MKHLRFLSMLALLFVGCVDNESPFTPTDLNYSFLIKTFSKLSESEKLKLIQILKNSGSIKEVV